MLRDDLLLKMISSLNEYPNPDILSQVNSQSIFYFQ